MKCKRCKREIPDNSIYCNWCGTKQLLDRTEIKVPVPQKRGKCYWSRVTANGRSQYVSAATEEEYYAKARAVKAGFLEMKKAAPKMTLRAAIKKYLDENRNLISPSTLNGFESYERTRFQKYMDMDISQINWGKMINEEAEHYASATVRNAWSLVTQALAYSKYQKPEIKLPKKTKPNRNWLDYQQIEIFCKAIYGKPYEPGALLALNGLRRSELLHLTADDVDTGHGLIFVRGASVVGLNNKLVDKDTNKTHSSTRTVHIVIPRLNELLKGKTGRLITTNPTTLYGSINDLCRSVSLPEVGVHGLRHSFASLAYHLKWSELTTMREGGWKDPKIVHEIYTHLAEQDANADIERMKQFYTVS